VYKEVFLRELVEDIANHYKVELAEREIAFRFDIPDNQTFFSYPAMVRIILENLIENAVQFAGMDKPYIQIMTREAGRDIVLEISDNGQGIHAEYQDRVFDMYFRANERSKGNGLGLYIVRKAVEKLGGKISFQSQYGSGSVFTIILPPEAG